MLTNWRWGRLSREDVVPVAGSNGELDRFAEETFRCGTLVA
jgi:hypothetical protein